MATPKDQEPGTLIDTVAKVLHGNGQQTEDTLESVRRLGRHYGWNTAVTANWGELIVRHGGAQAAPAPSLVEVAPVAIGMNRVIAANRVVQGVLADTLSTRQAVQELAKAAAASPSSNGLFAMACAVGAVALSVTFGVAHLPAVVLIFSSAGLGGYLRRHLGDIGADGLTQAFCAALLAGVVGAVGVRLGLSSDLRLIALCPCMVIVPGPHLLNGMLDLLGGRIPLGAARLIFALLVLTAISAGVLLGMTLCGAAVPPAPAGRSPPVWLIMLAGAVAGACYGVFYSMPPRLLVWPAGMAVIVDTLRWAVMNLLDQGPVVGAAVAGVVAGMLIIPLARHHHLPFAGVGFASIVSLMPGVFVFRMAGGLWALQTARAPDISALLQASAIDGLTAALIILAMTLGIVAPKYLHDTLSHAAREAAR
jgi:uncharacterized membrane protein YjjP (DUF1212 family)